MLACSRYRYLHVAHRLADYSASCGRVAAWPLPRIRREVSTWTPSSFDPRDKSAPTTLKTCVDIYIFSTATA
jgi:hypothetical protein